MRHKRMRRTLQIILGVAVLIVTGAILAAVVADIRNDQKTRLRITGETQLLAHPRPQNQGNQVVGRVARDEAVQVRRIRYGKDFMAIKVRTTHGDEGWLILGESAFEILPSTVPHNSVAAPDASRATVLVTC